jgi:hypothetical protein
MCGGDGSPLPETGAWYRIGLNFTALLQPIPNADDTWDTGG